MEAERDSLYKAIGYAKREALQSFSKEVFCSVVNILYLWCCGNPFMCVYSIL